MSFLDPSAASAAQGPGVPPRLTRLLQDLPIAEGASAVESAGDVDARLSLADLRTRVEDLAATLHAAGVGPGTAVGTLVPPGPAGVVTMFAAWAAGATYVPINRRLTGPEVSAVADETPMALLVGTADDLARYDLPVGRVALGASETSTVLAPARTDAPRYPDDIALALRTSGTTGRPKAVLLRHSGTIDALDASLAKLRRARARTADTRASRPHRMNLIPVSLALWAGIFNSLFSFRAGFGVVLLDRFATDDFVRAVRTYDVRSTVLAPAMIKALVDAPELRDLGPLRLVRSITAPLSPALARRFHERFGAFVLNSYGQTELGGEVVGWTTEDLRRFGETKLGAAGRPYEHVDLRVRRDDGADADPDEVGEIHVRSPYRMSGYAQPGGEPDDGRFSDGYLRTGDIGRLDADGFLWVEGRVSDMINRGGLKVFPDEVEEVLRRHPAVREAAVAGVPDGRLGEVPHAWVVTDRDVADPELSAWCREQLAPYKVPAGFTRVDALPRSDIGKVLRRQLVESVTRTAD